MFAIYFPKEKMYGRFGSYSSVTLVDLPEQASLYSREKDALSRKLYANRTMQKGNIYPWSSPAVIREIAFSHTITRTL